MRSGLSLVMGLALLVGCSREASTVTSVASPSAVAGDATARAAARSDSVAPTVSATPPVPAMPAAGSGMAATTEQPRAVVPCGAHVATTVPPVASGPRGLAAVYRGDDLWLVSLDDPSQEVAVTSQNLGAGWAGVATIEGVRYGYFTSIERATLSYGYPTSGELHACRFPLGGGPTELIVSFDGESKQVERGFVRRVASVAPNGDLAYVTPKGITLRSRDGAEQLWRASQPCSYPTPAPSPVPGAPPRAPRPPSCAGLADPLWSPDGASLFYRVLGYEGASSGIGKPGQRSDVSFEDIDPRLGWDAATQSLCANHIGYSAYDSGAGMGRILQADGKDRAIEIPPMVAPPRYPGYEPFIPMTGCAFARDGRLAVSFANDLYSKQPIMYMGVFGADLRIQATWRLDRVVRIWTANGDALVVADRPPSPGRALTWALVSAEGVMSPLDLVADDLAGVISVE